MLQSAFIHPEDMNLPRFRKSTMHSNNSTPSNFYGRSPSVSSHNETNNDDSSDDMDRFHLNQPEESQVDDSSDVSRATSPETPEKPKRPRGRPKKSLVNENGVQKARPRGRPKKIPTKMQFSLSSLELEEGPIATRRVKRTTKSPSVFEEPIKKVKPSKPVSLTKLRANGVQKPLDLDIERLNTGNNRDKRYRVNTLDVLKHLVANFEPGIVEASGINAAIVQSEFKTHLMDHLKHLVDIHGSVDDLTHEISSVQKQKEEIRRSVFELRADHSHVGNELNKLRASFQSSKDNYEKFNTLMNEINDIKQGMKQRDNHQNKGDIIRSIDREIQTMSKLFNPTTGLNNRLIEVNEILERINDNH